MDECSIGCFYFSGRIFKQDYSKAVFWFNNAVIADDVRAQGALGDMYVVGLGVQKDLEQANDWFSQPKANPNFEYDAQEGVVVK